MSLGYGWRAHLIMCDKETAAYSYHTYDFTLPAGKNGWGVTEDDGLMWAHVADDRSLEIELEKPSKYCSGKGVYSAEVLFSMCAYKMKRQFQDDGGFPLEVYGNI